MSLPDLIKKDKELILKEIEGKVLYYTPEWKYGVKGEFGTALAQIFAHLSELVINRLNRAPYRHSIAFLETFGASFLPPQPAKAPQTFLLSNGTTDNVLIPASTQVSAKGIDGKPVYFETDKALVATPAKLSCVYSVVRNTDEIFSHSKAVDGTDSSSLFSGTNLQKHILYIGETNLFNIRKASVVLQLQDSGKKVLAILVDSELVAWEYSVEITEKKNSQESKSVSWRQFDKTGLDTESENILLYRDSNEKIAEVFLFNVKSRWIRCRLKGAGIGLLGKIKVRGIKVSVCNSAEKSIDVKKIHGIGDEYYEKLAGKDAIVRIETVSELLRHTPDELSEILNCGRLRAENILEAARKEFYNKKGDIKIIEEAGIAPDMAFCNDMPADLSKPIYPFGMKPQLYSSFYISSGEAFSKKGYNVNLLLKLHRGVPSSAANAPQLSWEYWDGEAWKAFEGIAENMAAAYSATPVYYSVDTKPPAEDCLISIASLPEIKKTKINGKENYWIRIRLAGGDFGSEFIINNSNQITPGSFNAPVIESLKIEFSKDEPEYPEYLISENNCEYKTAKQFFLPFESLPDLKPAIYFGFDRKMKKGPMGLFAYIDEKFEYPEDFLPSVKWSCYTGNSSWKELDIKDGTSGFTKSGIVLFSVTGEMKGLALFGEKEKYWIKASVTGDFFNRDMLPVIKGFYLNTAWASQVRTIRKEILDSGGSKGNLQAGEIKKLQSAVASVDKVFNPAASEGGNDSEDTDSLLLRAPAILKNRGRATATDDFACIVMEASRDIAKVKVLSNLNDKGVYETGWVTVVIIPQGSDSKPYPTSGLRRKAKEYLMERCPNVVSVRVIPPEYIRADVSAEICTKIIESIPDIENETGKMISDFLHPLTGGTEGMGWDFGEIPCISDLYALLENLADVDYIRNLSITLYSDTNTKIGEITDSGAAVSVPGHALIYGGEQKLRVRSNNC